jgi:cytochrome c peroxidase
MSGNGKQPISLSTAKNTHTRQVQRALPLLTSIVIATGVSVFGGVALERTGFNGAMRVAYADEVTPESVKFVFPPLSFADADKQPKELVSLGKKLYMDTRFSKNKKLSCNSCHNLSTFGVDREPTSPGHEGKRGNRNSPTVFNASLHVAQFWDGRAADVEAQALGPVLNPVEMGLSSPAEVEKIIAADKEYTAMFKAAFPAESTPITFANFGKAIGSFERTLITPSRYDEFAAGKADALTAEEKKGLKKFMETGCTACHMGSTFGGGIYQKLGLVKPYETKDLGRYEVTKNETDKLVFKVPSLRNVAETGPYFHDGSVKDLPTAVKLMASHQLGKELSEDDTKSIVTFLNALTGKVRE